MKAFRFLLLILFLVSPIVKAQELPPIQNFQAKDYGAENQNWAISQAKNKFIYIANNKGLLEFNGADWQLYPSPNGTIFRSVKVYENKIFTGFFMDFGFWQKNGLGQLKYTSIVKKKKLQMLEDEQIWNIVEIDGWLIFKSLERIYMYNFVSEEIRIINVENRITKLAKIEGVIYFQEITKGVFEIENGEAKLISDDPILQDNGIVQIFKRDNKLLFLTEVNGFYFLDDGKVKKWNSDADNFLQNTKIYSAKQLRNGDFILGTVAEGVLSLNGNGKLNYQISKTSGLNNNTVLSIFEDLQNNIWVGLDNGISCINNTSPFSYYKRESEFLGTVYASEIFEDHLYLGTNQGLFFRPKDADVPFTFVQNTQGQVWNLIVVDDTLFCGHDSGTFIVNKNSAQKIFTSQGTWDIKKYDKNHLIQGSYDGMYVLERANGTWKLKNKIKGFNKSTRYFVINDANTIFVNHEYKGVYKLAIDKGLSEVNKVNIETSIKKGLYSSLIKYKNKLLFTSKEGVFIYDDKANNFLKDSIFSQLISSKNYTSGKLIYKEKSDQLWSFSKENIKYFSTGKLSDIPILHNIPILEPFRKGATGYENIISISAHKNLLGTANGYVTVNLEEVNNPEEFEISINSIQVFARNTKKRNVNLAPPMVLENNENNVEISFSVPNYNKLIETKYQYKLEGLNTDWNSLLSSNAVLFENIPYGNYTFKVRASIGDKMTSNVASFKLTILKPWYLSSFMIFLYVFIIFLIIYGSHIVSRKYYKKQKDILLEKTKKEAELNKLESSQKIIKLNNDKLRSDIETKNKELASSTMNLIKKNEFLNSIKKELVSEDKNSIYRVVKIIDKNLNNTDDWKMFQEAFNNADKKFLKKLKSKHDKLTPNDLRLCAYLRLNLSSKEIAPLLNISTRSVEVKRYRLRKKLDLDHDANLTNYILEI